MANDIMTLADGAPDPGMWVHSVWRGPHAWKRQLGKALVLFNFGKPVAVQGDVTVDGQFLRDVDTIASMGRIIRDNQRVYLCRRKVNDVWTYYRIDIQGNDVSLETSIPDPSLVSREHENVVLQRLEESPLVKEFCLVEENARALYQALCNHTWVGIREHDAGFAIEVSWRSAGDIVADIRPYKENYNDFYCNALTSEGDILDHVRNVLLSIDIICQE